MILRFIRAREREQSFPFWQRAKCNAKRRGYVLYAIRIITVIIVFSFKCIFAHGAHSTHNHFCDSSLSVVLNRFNSVVHAPRSQRFPTGTEILFSLWNCNAIKINWFWGAGRGWREWRMTKELFGFVTAENGKFNCFRQWCSVFAVSEAWHGPSNERDVRSALIKRKKKKTSKCYKTENYLIGSDVRESKWHHFAFVSTLLRQRFYCNCSESIQLFMIVTCLRFNRTRRGDSQ